VQHHVADRLDARACVGLGVVAEHDERAPVDRVPRRAEHALLPHGGVDRRRRAVDAEELPELVDAVVVGQRVAEVLHADVRELLARDHAARRLVELGEVGPQVGPRLLAAALAEGLEDRRLDLGDREGHHFARLPHHARVGVQVDTGHLVEGHAGVRGVDDQRRGRRPHGLLDLGVQALTRHVAEAGALDARAGHVEVHPRRVGVHRDANADVVRHRTSEPRAVRGGDARGAAEALVTQVARLGDELDALLEVLARAHGLLVLGVEHFGLAPQVERRVGAQRRARRRAVVAPVGHLQQRGAVGLLEELEADLLEHQLELLPRHAARALRVLGLEERLDGPRAQALHVGDHLGLELGLVEALRANVFDELRARDRAEPVDVEVVEDGGPLVGRDTELPLGAGADEVLRREVVVDPTEDLVSVEALGDPAPLYELADALERGLDHEGGLDPSQEGLPVHLAILHRREPVQ